MFKEKKFGDNKRQSFQIVMGLKEGYDSGKIHTKEDVKVFIHQWMEARLTAGLPIITGGILFPGTVVYTWSWGVSKAQFNAEEVVVFAGEINPLYNTNLNNSDALGTLKDLTRFLGEQLNQTRMYLTYMDEIFIFENDKATHPTGK